MWCWSLLLFHWFSNNKQQQKHRFVLQTPVAIAVTLTVTVATTKQTTNHCCYGHCHCHCCYCHCCCCDCCHCCYCHCCQLLVPLLLSLYHCCYCCYCCCYYCYYTRCYYCCSILGLLLVNQQQPINLKQQATNNKEWYCNAVKGMPEKSPFGIIDFVWGAILVTQTQLFGGARWNQFSLLLLDMVLLLLLSWLLLLLLSLLLSVVIGSHIVFILSGPGQCGGCETLLNLPSTLYQWR